MRRSVIERYLEADAAGEAEAQVRVARLTERERDVLAMVGTGLSNKEIAERLYLSEATVKVHVRRILTKLDCANRVQAAILAHRAGLVPGP
jgi:DNA-binding NarL/FixJ family response regulator